MADHEMKQVVKERYGQVARRVRDGGEGCCGPDGTVDVIISNCVIDLSVDKDRVFAEASGKSLSI